MSQEINSLETVDGCILKQKTSDITRKEGFLDIMRSDVQNRIVIIVLNFKKRNSVNNGVTGQK